MIVFLRENYVNLPFVLFAAQYGIFHSSSSKRIVQDKSGFIRAIQARFGMNTDIIEYISIRPAVFSMLRSGNFPTRQPLFNTK
jgi:hypothetical protein